MFKNRLDEIEIQTVKTKDRREAERKERQRKEKHQLETYDFLQGSYPTFHASNTQDFRHRIWSSKENTFFRKSYLKVLDGWQGEEKKKS